MKNFILIVIFSILTFNSFGQFYDDCATAGSNIDPIASGAIPHTVNGDIPATNNNADYDASASFANYKTGFYSFTVATNGYYNIHFEASGGGTATGDLSVGWDAAGGACPPSQTDADDITTGFDISSDCVNLTAGTTYYISMALENGHEGTFSVTIDKGEDVCDGVLESMIEGTNHVDNSCSAAPPSPAPGGTIWTTYTVTNADGADHIAVDISAVVNGTLNPPHIYSVLLNDCSGDDVTSSARCLSVGDILYIESGNTDPLFGDYDIQIDQYQQPVTNDDCASASDAGTLTCATTVTGASDINACGGGEEDCNANPVEGVWYHFVASSAVNTFDFTGTEFRVWTGPDCNNLTELGCDGDAALTDVVADPNTIYWVMKWGTGDFTATSDATVPANDLCANAEVLTPGTAAEGSNVCATWTWDYCDISGNTAHEVFYSYTNNTANTTDIDVLIDQSTATNGIAATDLSVAIITDACTGTAFNNLGPECNTLGTSFNIGCIDPGEKIILVVGSVEGTEGDFSITITENTAGHPANDVCTGATDFGEITSSCTKVDNAADNTGACSDNYTDGGCGFDANTMMSVWYTFSTDANAEFVDIETDLTDALFSLYTGADCNSLTYEANSCTSDGTLDNLPVLPNTTYYILIGSNTTESTFNIGITVKNIPDNNLCADAVVIADGLDGTNACSDAEYDYCNQVTGTTHEVYYKYTNNNGANVDLDVTVTGNTNTTGTAATGLDVAIMTDACDGTLYNAPNNTFCATLATQFTIECIEDGETIILVFGSEDSQEGDFGISITENVSSVTNDECSGADDIAYTACQWESVSTDNTGACFEDFTVAGCDYDTEPVVWMKFDATANATSVEFDNFTTGGTGFLGLFEETVDCDNQTEAAAGSACNTGSGPFGPFDITGGNTYYIALGSSGGEGAINFDIKVNESPVNDDPCSGTFAPIDLTDGTTFTDNNTCAGFDFTSCNVDNTTGKTLFYEHTMTQDANLEININGTTANGPFTIATYDGDIACGDESNFILDNCTDNTLTLLCKLAGEKVVIMIGTSETAGEFGEYEITVNEVVVARPANDLCTDAEEVIYNDADLCKWKGADNNESNINACSEDNDFGTACDYTNEEVVWFKFTTPPATVAGSSVSIRFMNYTGTGTLFATMFDDGADCTNLTVSAGGGCATGNGPNGLGTVDPNTTYLIGVGSTGDTGGDFDLEIKITSGPPNDDACADMTNYDLTAGGTLPDEQTNACSGAGMNFPECSGDDQTNAVFYTFTITAPVYGINVEITQSGAEPIDGIVVAGISEVNTEFCNGTTYHAPAYCEDISTAQFEWKCLEEGTYQLQISTSDPNSGTFNITSTMLDKPNNDCNLNDKCDDAKELDATLECEWNDFLKECNEDACPDPYVVGTCDMTVGPTTWFKVLIPTGAASIDVIIDNASSPSGVDMVIAKEADACPLTAGWCGSGGTLAAPIMLDATDEGTYYYIAVIDIGGGNGGTFDIHIKIDVPPINDSPCMANDRPPYDLGTGGSHSGTTCCAVGANDDPNQDQANVDCNAASDDNAVWYRAEYDSNQDGVSINITGGTIGGSIGVEVYVGGADAACDGTAEFRKSKCDGLPVTDMHIGCLEDGDYVFIKVANSDNDGDCGTFDISVESIKDCDVADACEDITGAQELDPVTPEDVVVNYVCTLGCLDLACPDPGLPGGCGGFNTQPTVWFQVNTDADAAQLYTTVTTNGSWTPVWSIFYSPNNDCTDLTNAAGNGSFPCSLDASPPAPPLITGVTEGVYYIAVSANEGDVIDDPNFEVCAATIKNVVVCLGPDLGCGNDETLVFEVTERENTDAEPNGPPYFGPFCPGEELTVHMNFTYDATQTGDDWIIGMIPKFGNGWDMTGFSFAANPPTGTPMGASEYYEETGGCAPLVMEKFSFLCTYTDDDGHLRLCNTLCENCPCSGGMVEQDPLPSGYFWVQEGSSPDCDANNCSPSRKYGIGSPVSTIDWEINLKVKEFANQAECMENDDLLISFMTFSDGGAGCWDDPIGECLIDKPQFSPPWKVNCDIPPGVIATPQPQDICSGAEAGVDVTTEDGSTELIEITFDDNPNVDGESDHSFADGFGTIDDVLTINDADLCDVEIVTYYAQVIIEGMICEGKIDTIEVNVYPLPRIPEQDDIFGACMSDLPYTLPIDAECGYPGSYTFSWSDDISGNTGEGSDIIIDASFGAGLHTFSITVTDDLGCENTGELKFNVYPDVEFKLQGDTLCWGEYKEFTVDLLGRESYDFEFNWYWNPGEGDNGGDETYIIEVDEYGTVYPPSENPEDYQLCLELTEEHDDGVVCSHDTCVNVWFRKPMNLTLNPGNPVYLCEGQNCVNVEVVFDEDNGMLYDEVYEIYWNGDITNNPEHEFCETSPGNFVQIIDVFGCDTTIDFDILANPVTDIVIEGDTTICVGDCTTLTVKDDFDSYTWNTGDDTKSITVCPTDALTTYEVSAINSSGCVSAGSVNVHVFTAEVPNIPPTATFCTGFSTTVTAPAGYSSYNWYFNDTNTSPVSTTADVTINQTGNYIIVVVSPEGCAAQDTVVASEDSELSPFVVGDTSLCFEQTNTLMIALGGNFTLYEWRYNDANGALVIPETDKDSIYLAEGTYHLHVSDGNCAGNTSFTITRRPKVEPKIMPDVDTIHICYGADTTLTAPAGFDAYKWSNGSFNRIVTGVSQGKYFVTVTDEEGCQGVDSIYVNEYPRMYPSLQDSVEICADDKATLTPGKFADYIWAKDGVHLAGFDGKKSIEVTDGGYYSVIVSNAIGCTAFDTIKVIKTDNLTPVIVGAKDLCDDDEITLTISGTYDSYKWTNSTGKVLGTEATLTFTMTPGKDIETITLEVKSNTGCLGSDQVTINRYHSPELELDHNPVKDVCGKGSTNPAVLNFDDYFIKGNSSMGNWRDFDNSNATHNSDWTSVDFATVDPGKTYRFVFRTTSANAPCSDVVDTIYITVIACSCEQWEISEFADVCNDENTAQINLSEHIINAAGDRIIPVPTGVWTVSPSGTGVVSGNKFIASGAASGTYTLTYKFNDKGIYCSDTHTQTIIVQNAVNPGTPQPQHVCEGTSEEFDLGGLLIGGDAGGVWTEVSTIPSTGGAFDATAGTFNTDGQNVGEFIFEYKLVGVDPCPDKSARVSIIVDPTPIADAGDVTACFEEKPVTLHAKNEADRYEWTKKGETDILGTNREYSTSQSGTYVLKVLSSLGCSTEKDIEVDIKPEIVASISGASVLQNGASDTLFANVAGRGVDDIRIYNWTKDGEPIDTVHSNFLIVSDKGVYCVEVEDNEGCTGDVCHTVTVAITKDIEVPNVFTPDGDGKNDKFFVKDGKNVKHIRTFKVWDRWGNLIYSDKDFSFQDRKNHFWNGDYNGKKAMQGVYVYLVEFTWSDNKDDFVSGDVTLIR